MKQKIIAMGIFSILFFFGCTHNNDVIHIENDEAPSTAITQWTDKMEIFMEYPVMVKNTEGKFIIHLTFMDDFQPIRDGAVTLTFQHSSGKKFEFTKNELLREGIFTPILELPLTGEYEFILSYNNSRVSESFLIPNFIVYESLNQIPFSAEEAEGGISFLKEQQWKIEFGTQTVQSRTIRKSIQAVGEILPKQSQYAEIISPVDGIMRIDDNASMVIPGSHIQKGQVLATLAPPLGALNSWTDRKLDFEYAKTEYERAKRLQKKNAISNREFEEIKHNYLVQNAGYEAYVQSGNSDLFQLKAPMSGIVTGIAVLPGQKVFAGEKLMSIVDPSMVWLRTDVFEKDYYEMDKPNGASITVPGLPSPVDVNSKNFSLLSMGITLDSQSRTIPVLLEITNRDGYLKIGQTVLVTLYTATENHFPAVPENAIFEDETNEIVFIHVDGESFEKRIVKTGNKDNGFVAILHGLKPGERVVTNGGYLVKLASTSAAVGHPHAH
ncbi:MAG: efflux RND transporter periplasmic adaptor subunit [Candidatus Marinimicrobia bacterium]|nr:efflux RND transporter periplasmic adaptor subunit [Candidatus Neomarinimicrobiota bacterium]